MQAPCVLRFAAKQPGVASLAPEVWTRAGNCLLHGHSISSERGSEPEVQEQTRRRLVMLPAGGGRTAAPSWRVWPPRASARALTTSNSRVSCTPTSTDFTYMSNVPRGPPVASSAAWAWYKGRSRRGSYAGTPMHRWSREGVPREKLHHCLQPVDERFWRPGSGAPDHDIVSVGSEARDYRTLLAASVGLRSAPSWRSEVPSRVAGDVEADFAPLVSESVGRRLPPTCVCINKCDTSLSGSSMPGPE